MCPNAKMNSVIEKIIGDITRNKSAIFELSNKYKKRENHISKLLFESLEWDVNVKPRYDGLFGWGGHITDGCLKINEQLVIIEVKTVKPKGRDGYEYAYFHALVQGLIYSYQQQRLSSEQNFLVLCIILDWGRAAKRILNDDEKQFLGKVRNDRIYFLRVNMSKKYIEHNMNTNWAIIKEDV